MCYFVLPSCSTALGYSRAINGPRNSSSKSGSVNDFASGSFSRFAAFLEASMTSNRVTIVMPMRMERVGFFLGLPIWKIVPCIDFPSTKSSNHIVNDYLRKIHRNHLDFLTQKLNNHHITTSPHSPESPLMPVTAFRIHLSKDEICEAIHEAEQFTHSPNL